MLCKVSHWEYLKQVREMSARNCLGKAADPVRGEKGWLR